jgi:hypothetical protein
MPTGNDSELKREDSLLLEALATNSMEWEAGLEVGIRAGFAAGLAYPPLARLERLGAVESKWEESGVDGKPRRVYRITGVGQRIAGELTQPVRERRGRRLPDLGFPEGQIA